MPSRPIRLLRGSATECRKVLPRAVREIQPADEASESRKCGLLRRQRRRRNMTMATIMTMITTVPKPMYMRFSSSLSLLVDRGRADRDAS